MPDDDDDLFSNLDIDYLNANVVANQPTNVQQNPTTNVNQLLDDDDDMLFDNIPDVPAAEPSNINLRSNHNNFDDDDLDLAEVEANIQRDIQNEELGRLTSNANTESSLKSTVPATQHEDHFDSDLDELFRSDSMMENAAAQPISHDIIDRNYEFKIAGCPLVTILQLHSMDASDRSDRSFVVKCEIFKAVDKIQIISNRYKLVVLIEDSTGLHLEVS